MSKFAAYSADRVRAPRVGAAEGLVVRPTVAADLPDVARVVAEREGGDAALFLARLTEELARQTDPPRSLLWAALVRERVVGHARASWFTPPADAPPDVAPEGWYLGGVVVDPAFRGRGIGTELTRRRLDWIAERAPCAYYFANARNRVSLEMHAKLGFVEVTRAFSYPGVTFTGGVGVLSRWVAPAPS
jgi:GNAT superfamily N-acetyltransferase